MLEKITAFWNKGVKEKVIAGAIAVGIVIATVLIIKKKRTSFKGVF